MKLKYLTLKHLILCAAMILAVGCLFACTKKENPDNKSDSGNTNDTSSEKKDTEEKTTPNKTDNKVKYTIKVVDEAGNAIAGAMVQLCSESCIPGKTNESGVAEFNVDEDEYKASFISLPNGYAYTTQETDFYFEKGKTELTITLKAQ